VCDSATAAEGLRRAVQLNPAPWAEWRAAARADYEANVSLGPCPGPVHPGEIAVWLRDVLPEDAVITTGAGNFSGWPQRYHRFRRFRSQLGPTNGSMGYGLPAAIAAKLADPQRVVVCWTGDGDFLMTGQELATAVAQGLDIIVILVNNGLYGTIRMHQERTYPGRVSATDLHNPDFAAYARAFGAHGEVVERTEDFPRAFARARASGRAALIELRIDPEAISTRTTLSAIRQAALKSQCG
jgi:acetolactate synthase-1/2/3 large subunit